MATSAPAEARRSARPRPIRLAAPVTNAVLPCRFSKLLRKRRLFRWFCAVGLALWRSRAARGPFAVAVERVLFARTLHFDDDLFALRIDLVVLAEGLPAIGNHLQPHHVADWDD